VINIYLSNVKFEIFTYNSFFNHSSHSSNIILLFSNQLLGIKSHLHFISSLFQIFEEIYQVHNAISFKLTSKSHRVDPKYVAIVIKSVSEKFSTSNHILTCDKTF